MKQLKNISVIILLTAVFTCLVACSSDNENKEEEGTNYKSLIIGKWKLYYESNYIHTHVEFKKSGTFSYTSIHDYYYEEHGEYKIEDNYLYMHFSDEPHDDWSIIKIVNLNNTMLTLQELYEDGECGKEIVYVKEGSLK